MVTGQDKNVLRTILLYKIDILVYSVSRALIPVRVLISLIRGEYGKSTAHTVKIPRRTIANVFVKRKGLILR